MRGSAAVWSFRKRWQISCGLLSCGGWVFQRKKPPTFKTIKFPKSLYCHRSRSLFDKWGRSHFLMHILNKIGIALEPHIGMHFGRNPLKVAYFSPKIFNFSSPLGWPCTLQPHSAQYGLKSVRQAGYYKPNENMAFIRLLAGFLPCRFLSHQLGEKKVCAKKATNEGGTTQDSGREGTTGCHPVIPHTTINIANNTFTASIPDSNEDKVGEGTFHLVQNWRGGTCPPTYL